MDRKQINLVLGSVVFWLLLLSFSSSNLLAQRFLFEEFTSEHGLPSEDIYSLYSDRQGFLWISTSGGLCRYDGVDLEVFTTRDGIPEYEIVRIHEDVKGNVWFRSLNHLFYFDGLKMRQPESGSAYQRAYTIFRDRAEQLWWEKGDSIYCLDSKLSFKLAKGDWSDGNLIYAIYYQDHHLQYLATTFGLVRCRDGDCVNLTRQADKTTQVYDIESFDGAFWLQTDEGIQKFDGLKYSQEGIHEDLKRNITNRMLKDPSGVLWFGTIKGLFRYDGKTYEQFTTADGLIDQRIRSLYLDRRSKLWISSRESLVLFDGEHFHPIDNREDLQSNIRMSDYSAICEDVDGNIWVNQANGLRHYNRWNLRLFDEESGWTSKEMYSMIRDSLNNVCFIDEDLKLQYWTRDGIKPLETGLDTSFKFFAARIWNDNLYVIGDQGAFRIEDGQATSMLPDSLFDATEQFMGLRKDSIDRHWVYSGSNLYRGSDSLWTKIPGPENPYEGQNYSNAIVGLAPASKDLMYVITRQGVYSLKDRTYSKIHDTNPGAVIYDMEIVNPGNFWVLNSREGLQRVQGKQVTTFSAEDGMSSNRPLKMALQDSMLWINYQYGLDRLNIREFERNRIPLFENFGEEDGFKSLDCTRVLQVFEDHVWIGTEETIYQYSTMATDQQQGPVSVKLQEIELFREKVNWGAFVPSLIAGTKLPHNLVLTEEEDFLSFYFKARTFSQQPIYYQYRLEGLEKEWRDPAQKEVAHYPNLPPGKYKFQVRASTSLQLFGEASDAFEFEISAPFYRKTWFIWAVIAGLILLQLITMVYIIHLRLRMNNY